MTTRKGERAPETKATAAGLLAQGLGMQEVADEVGVNRTTLWRWCTEDAEFIQLRREHTDAIVKANVDGLRALSTKALRVLDESMDAKVAVAVKDMETGEETILEVVDHRTRLRGAVPVMRSQPEFAERRDVNVHGSMLEAALAELRARGS